MSKLTLFNNSLQRITRKKEYFSQFESLQDWFYKENEETINREIVYLANIKEHLIKKYQSKDVFISPSALDDIIFYVCQKFDASESVREIDNLIIKSGVHRNSVVIFPLHSFGFKYLGARHLFKGFGTIRFCHKEFCMYPQTNSFKKSRDNVLSYLDYIKLPNRKKLNISLLGHYCKSRNLRWFKFNPLMILHFKFSQQDPYDNLRFIIEKVNFVTNKLYFIHALSNTHDNKGSLFSTRNTNNWETLDIKHFLTISTSKGKADINCLPVHFFNLMIFENMHMNIDLNVELREKSKWLKDAIDSVDTLYSGYLSYSLYKSKTHQKFYRLSNSLKYFRRSIKSISCEDKITNLHTALETILLDKFESEKKKTMLERLWRIFRRKQQERKKEIFENAGNLIDERNMVIHSGVPPQNKLNYPYLYRLYCRLILNLTKDINEIDSTQDRYISRYYDSF